MYVYNISGGVANIFDQSCAQIDNNQEVYEVQIQVPRCNSILKAGSHECQQLSPLHLDQCTDKHTDHSPNSTNLTQCLYSVLHLGKILLLDRCSHPSPNIFSSIIFIYTLFYYYYYYHHFYFYIFLTQSLHPIYKKQYKITKTPRQVQSELKITLTM